MGESDHYKLILLRIYFSIFMIETPLWMKSISRAFYSNTRLILGWHIVVYVYICTHEKNEKERIYIIKISSFNSDFISYLLWQSLICRIAISCCFYFFCSHALHCSACKLKGRWKKKKKVREIERKDEDKGERDRWRTAGK